LNAHREDEETTIWWEGIFTNTVPPVNIAKQSFVGSASSTALTSHNGLRLFPTISSTEFLSGKYTVIGNRR
jgi:hypothetical protein